MVAIAFTAVPLAVQHLKVRPGLQKVAIEDGDGHPAARSMKIAHSRSLYLADGSTPMQPDSERNFARRIDLTSLQLFVAVCELGSIGRAAEREFIAASAISKRLSDLEATLDTPLLYRHTRGVDLTPAGESLLHHARSVLYSLEKMQGELSEYADGVRGHVRVHANISAIVQFLPEDLGAFTREHDAGQDRPRGAPEQRSGARGAGRRGRPRHLQRLRGHGDELQTPALPPRRTGADRAARPPAGAQQAIAFEDTLDFDHVGLHSNSSIYLAMREAAAGGRPHASGCASTSPAWTPCAA